jgi:hypothetical protein
MVPAQALASYAAHYAVSVVRTDFSLSRESARQTSGQREDEDMPEWNAAATMPDLLDVVMAAIQADTLEVTQPEQRTPAPTTSKVESIDARTARQVLDRHLADGMPLAQAVEMTRRYMERGGDSVIYRVTTLADQKRYNTQGQRVRFEGFYRGAPAVHQSVSCGRTIPEASQVAGSSRKSRAWALAEEWRAMRR